jgi:hypothetical protein
MKNACSLCGMVLGRAVLLFAAAGLAGCGLFPSAQERAMQKSPNFHAGYSDGCAAASTSGANPREGAYRDEALYKNDAAYRAGWSNGYSLCRGGTAPGAGLGNPVTNPIPGQH